MYAYREAVRQIREHGYVEDSILSRLTSADLARAVIEASEPA